MKIRAAQLIVSREIETNLARVLGVIDESGKGDWIVFPEAVLSGYYPQESSYTEQLDWAQLKRCLAQIQVATVDKGCRCLIGSAVLDDGEWRNSVQLFGAEGDSSQHHKAELSALDQKHFSPGKELKVHRLDGVTVGALACRELLFPGLWSTLREEGAKVMFHLNNALHPGDAIWKHILIARAIENAAFVVSVNNADQPQALPSFVIAPDGTILHETVPQTEVVFTQVINLDDAPDNLALRTDF